MYTVELETKTEEPGKGEDMENLIKFKTDERPLHLVSRTSRFPYEDVLKSLRVLSSTKAIVFDKTECSMYNLIKLRKLSPSIGIKRIYHAKKDGKLFVWGE